MCKLNTFLEGIYLFLMLSRLCSCPGEAIQGLDISVHEVHLHLNASPTGVCQIQEESAKDSTLSTLREVIMRGWPDRRSGSSELKVFFVLDCLDVWELGPKLVFRDSDPPLVFRHVFFRLRCEFL